MCQGRLGTVVYLYTVVLVSSVCVCTSTSGVHRGHT